MNKTRLLESIKPVSSEELQELRRLYHCAKELYSDSNRENVRCFFELIDELKANEAKLSEFLVDPQGFFDHNPHYAKIFSLHALERFLDLRRREEAGNVSASSIQQCVAEAGLQPVQHALFTAFSKHTALRKAILASACLAFLYASIVLPLTPPSYSSTRPTMYGKEPVSMMLARDGDVGSRFVLPIRESTEEYQFARATALGKLAIVL